MDAGGIFSQTKITEPYYRYFEINMAIKIETLRAFVAAAKTGSLSEAAAQLGRTPSAVSMTLKQFEDELGTSLFETDRKNRLSPTGRFAVTRAEQMIAQFDHLIDELKSHARGEAGTVRIASVPSFAASVLPVVVRELSASNPELSIDIRDMDSASVLQALHDKQVDIGIATAGLVDVPAQSVPLMRDAYGLVFHKGHPATQGDLPQDWGRYANERFIANDLCGQITDPGFQDLMKRATLRVRNTMSLLAMVGQGLGITVMPRLSVPPDHPSVVFRALKGPPAYRHITLYTVDDTTHSPVIQSVINAIRNEAALQSDI